MQAQMRPIGGSVRSVCSLLADLQQVSKSLARSLSLAASHFIHLGASPKPKAQSSKPQVLMLFCSDALLLVSFRRGSSNVSSPASGHLSPSGVLGLAWRLFRRLFHRRQLEEQSQLEEEARNMTDRLRMIVVRQATSSKQQARSGKLRADNYRTRSNVWTPSFKALVCCIES